jgi:toxin ParE1/3/4
VPRRRWHPRLGGEAQRDFEAILRWTVGHFGTAQARRYRATLLAAIRALAAGPDVTDSRARDDLAPGLRTLHVARRGRQGRHILLYRAVSIRDIEIVRILHDAMEMERHLSALSLGLSLPPNDC